ncbi:MAG: indole-3-glycerol phosphate synthase TrpC [Bacteroides sp.]|jgi:indole-3-glycerol phosphate synthase|nr:indole-3-glycerol phosphate synthase TrpC [Bacteroides sp.]MCI1683093.1 indole-3-glycerol phosphate synthase TrpC [Bacteroides sp.]
MKEQTTVFTDILTNIVANKRIEMERQKQAISIEHLREQVEAIMDDTDRSNNRRSMKQALASSNTGIIAEFKRKSPSKGWIKEAAQSEIIPLAYESAGATALSILTDEKFFGGSIRDIRTARSLVNIPILRKDFIIDEYQLLQARIIGADAILLIASCLTKEECHQLTLQAHALQLEVLLEVHKPTELSYISKETDMIGVNNRNLGTFVTDVENSFRIAEELKRAVAAINTSSRANSSDIKGSFTEEKNINSPLLISESGISNPETIRQLRSAGFQGFLIGETFMCTEHPEETLANFIRGI